MLAGLDDVPWASLESAFGSSAQVPVHIRALRSESSEERDAALGELFQVIWHQGTVYPATSRAVPFLIELLRDEQLPDRDQVAALVASVASGAGYLEVHAVGPGRKDAERAAAAAGTTLEAQLVAERAHVDAVRRAAAPEMPLLLPYLEHEVAEVRTSVAEAFGFYPDQADLLLAPLLRAMERESDPEVRSTMRDSARRLGGAPEPVDPASTEPDLSDPDPGWRPEAAPAHGRSTPHPRWLVLLFPTFLIALFLSTGDRTAALLAGLVWVVVFAWVRASLNR